MNKANTKKIKKKKYIKFSLTKREVQIIVALRNFTYGKMLIYKAEGKPHRIEISESLIIKDDGFVKNGEKK